MLFLVDGSNVTGKLAGAPRDDAAKRELVQLAARVSRNQKARVILFFDGPQPPSFATRFGSVEVRFTAPRSADDAITAEVGRREREAVTVVTSDSGLSARVRGRRVAIIAPRDFVAQAGEPELSDQTDWESYFSDPNNRNV